MKLLNNLTKEEFLATLQLLKIYVLVFKLFVFHLFSLWLIKIFH